MTDSKDGTTGGNEALVLGACCAAIATLVPVAMYQTGLVARLPDPPLRIFNSERIASSRAAHPFGLPDSLLGLASFSATLALILLSRKNKIGSDLLGAKLVLDGALGVFNATRQVVSFGKLCACCTGTAISAVTMAYAGRAHISGAWRDAERASRSITGLASKAESSSS